MNLLYNTQDNLASDLANYFKKISNLSKPHLNLIPYIILGMVQSESVVTSDISKVLKGDFLDVLPSSNIKKLKRFFNNDNFNIYNFYHDIISDVISNFKPKHKNVYIAFDHMYCRNSFTVLMFSLRIGKQGIPLWFRCFKGKDNPDAFQTSLINEGISYTHNLFANKDCNIFYLADRWFPNIKTMQFIDDIGDIYCIRARSNISIHIQNFKDSDMISSISDIEPFQSKSIYFENVLITKDFFPTKLVVSKSSGHKEPYFIFTNGNTRNAIKHYGFRFGSIETIFKSQKTNGFNLERTKTRNIQAFSSLYGLMCVALLWLTILGCNYSKNANHIKPYLKIQTSTRNGDGLKRILSLFNTGLQFFNLAFQCTKYAVIKCNFWLYDV